MNKAAYIPFYTSDFMGGTSGLSAAEKGVYITLLCLIYEAESAIDVPKKILARRCGCTVAALKNALDALEADGKISIDGDQIWSEKCAKHLECRRERRSHSVAAANIRWQKDQQKQGKADANASVGQCQPEPEPEPKKKETKVSKKVERPADVSPDLWSDFLSHRRAQRATLTVTALKGFEREAAKANLALPQAIQIAIERGWRGFKADWIKPEDRPKPQLVHSREMILIGVHDEPELFDEAVRWAEKYLSHAVRHGQEHIKIPAHVAANLRDGLKETA